MSWKDEAACAGTPPNVFFPRARTENVDDTPLWATAKAVCDDCTVASNCLEYALRENIGQGMFGGLTPRQRYRLRRGPRAVTALRLTCGTQTGYQAHLYRNETPCDECRAAHRQDRARRRAAAYG